MARVRNRPSTIDRLPPEIQELIGRLRREGRTIDEIHAKIMELDQEVSRSALGRHVKSLAEVQLQMRQSREVAHALVSQFGAEPDNKLAQANIEMMHNIVMRGMTALQEDEQGNLSLPNYTPEDQMFLARALQSLAGAAKTTDDRVIRARDLATKEAAKKAGNAAKSKGLGKETVEFITNAVLGVG